MPAQGANDSGGNGAVNSAGSWFADWQARTPAVTRYTLFTLFGVGVVGFITGLSEVILLCPYQTVMSFQLWRLVMAPLAAGGLLSFLFQCFWFGQQGPILEMQHGSVGLLYLMALIGLATNVLYTVLGFFFMYNPIIQTPMMMSCSGGFWPILLGLVSIECLGNPEGSRKLMCFPCNVKNKFFPWVLLAFFVVLSGGLSGGGPPMELVLGVVVGHLYSWGKLDRLKPTAAKLDAWESGAFLGLSTKPGFIARAAAGSTDLTLPGGGRGAGAGGGGGGNGSGSSGWVSQFSGDVFGRGRNAGGRDNSATGGSGSASGRSSGGAGQSSASHPPKPQMKPLSAEEIAERRKAAVAAAEARVKNSQRSSTQSNTRPDTPEGRLNDEAVTQMVSMGFPRESASVALLQTGGDVAEAIALLRAS